MRLLLRMRSWGRQKRGWSNKSIRVEIFTPKNFPPRTKKAEKEIFALLRVYKLFTVNQLEKCERAYVFQCRRRRKTSTSFRAFEISIRIRKKWAFIKLMRLLLFIRHIYLRCDTAHTHTASKRKSGKSIQFENLHKFISNWRRRERKGWNVYDVIFPCSRK